MSEQQKTPTGVVPSSTAAVPVRRNSNNDTSTIDVVDLFYRLLAGWKLILCLALVFAIGAGVYTMYFVTPMYSAKAIIYVLNIDSFLNVSSLTLGSTMTQDYIKIFDLWEVAAEVKENLNLPYSYSGLRSMISVYNTSGTRMLDITATSSSPKEAAAIANEYANVVSNYIHDTMATEKPSIMSVALEPTNPISPNRTRNIMLGFIIGAVLAAGIIVLQYLMDDKLKTVEDIRQYAGLPTLAVIPIEHEDEADISARRKSEKGENE